MVHGRVLIRAGSRWSLDESCYSPSSTVAAAKGARLVLFNGLGIDAAAVTSYAESGFAVTAMPCDWSVRNT
jgi:hypothetical protein